MRVALQISRLTTLSPSRAEYYCSRRSRRGGGGRSAARVVVVAIKDRAEGQSSRETEDEEEEEEPAGGDDGNLRNNDDIRVRRGTPAAPLPHESVVTVVVVVAFVGFAYALPSLLFLLVVAPFPFRFPLLCSSVLFLLSVSEYLVVVFVLLLIASTLLPFFLSLSLLPSRSIWAPTLFKRMGSSLSELSCSLLSFCLYRDNRGSERK